MDHYANLSMEQLLDPKGFDCSCGKHHVASGLRDVIIRSGAIGDLPGMLKKHGITRPYLVCDLNTDKAAGGRVRAVLDAAGIPYGCCCLKHEHVEPDETMLGTILMRYDNTCDGFVAIGSGVIGDLTKIASKACRLPMITVATAPSMDGYASTCASMLIDGLKTSLYARTPCAIIADLDVLTQAPMRMIQAGMGDMITKYVSLMEWRMANMINDEYWCSETSDLVARSAAMVYEAAPKLAQRDPAAIALLTEGLILAGIAVAFVGVSGPASGAEHYISHIWDMQSVDGGKPADLHGIQTGVCTIRLLKVYEHLRGYVPDVEKASAAIDSFDKAAWEKDVRRLYGSGSGNALANEEKSGKHDPAKQHAQLKRIVENWPELQEMICALPDASAVAALWGQTGAPLTHTDLGHTDTELVEAFTYSPEIRDKYVGSRLIWGLGLVEEAQKWVLEK